MSTMRRTFALLMLLTAAACSSGGGGGTAAPPAQSATVEREDYARQLAAWLCDDLAACCEGTGEAPDRDACIATKQQATLSRLAREEQKSGRAFDPEMAATCVAKLAETPASCGAERRVSECFRTYDGLLELGESCEYKTQCRDSLTGDVACVDGICTARLAAGEACVDRPEDRGRCDVCRPDARCRASATGETYCYAYERPRGVAGDPCASEFTPPADPTQVTVRAECLFEDGLYCAGDGRCAAFARIGEACSRSFECTRDARCEGGTCVAGRSVGEVCRSSFHDCGAGTYCHFTEFVCTDPSPGVPGECHGYDLISGRCELPATEGQPCGALIDCAEGLFCSRANPASSEGTCAVPPSLCTTGIAILQRQSR